MNKNKIMNGLSFILSLAVVIGFLTTDESESLLLMVGILSVGLLNAGNFIAEIVNRNLENKEPVTPENLAIMFHSFYEEMAPRFGYETREETRVFDETSPNGKLMVSVAKKILEHMN